MTPNLDSGRAHIEAAQAVSDMLLIIGAEARELTLRWIGSKIVIEQCKMSDCNKDKLPEMQIRMAILLEMRNDLMPQKKLPDCRISA